MYYHFNFTHKTRGDSLDWDIPADRMSGRFGGNIRVSTVEACKRTGSLDNEGPRRAFPFVRHHTLGRTACHYA